VVPQFTPLFESAGAELPLLTRVVIAAGDGAQRYWWLILLALAALV
jgi:general secretion pathway protein F